VGLVNHQTGAVALAQGDDLGQRRNVTLHREDAVDDDHHAAAVVLGGRQPLLEQIEPVVLERAQLGAGDQAAVEDRGVVGGVDDHRVAAVEDRAQRAEVRLVPGREHECRLGIHPVGQLGLQLEMQTDRPVEEARPGEPGAVAVHGVDCALSHALVAGETEVVVGAEHDPRGALHLHDRKCRTFQLTEVGDDVQLAREFQLREPLVVMDLGEDVGHRGSGADCRSPRRRTRPVARCEISLSRDDRRRCHHGA
jgi:hypothetical protein